MIDPVSIGAGISGLLGLLGVGGETAAVGTAAAAGAGGILGGSGLGTLIGGAALGLGAASLLGGQSAGGASATATATPSPPPTPAAVAPQIQAPVGTAATLKAGPKPGGPSFLSQAASLTPPQSNQAQKTLLGS